MRGRMGRVAAGERGIAESGLVLDGRETGGERSLGARVYRTEETGRWANHRRVRADSGCPRTRPEQRRPASSPGRR